MSYIKWKNINSDNIKGLLICELPPISKPKMRTSTIEIDGKDGDDVEFLGYKSYNKIIKIALTRNYNIDEIIKYFTGTGKLVLSSEPDKYYLAHIVDAIDYNRLINFKTASIKFHVQPYKYLLNEEPIVLDVTDETSFEITNVGIEQSKPIITLYGSGEVKLLINDINVFSINIDEEYVKIDSEQEEAYFESVLKNRQMLGDFPLLESGVNKISWDGNVTKIIVEPRSRWL